MHDNAGFYQPEQGENSKGNRSEPGKEVDYRKLFIVITERTGWTPQQIRELSVAQLNEYIAGWVETNEKSEQTFEPSEKEIALFNLASGIQTKRITKPDGIH